MPTQKETVTREELLKILSAADEITRQNLIYHSRKAYEAMQEDIANLKEDDPAREEIAEEANLMLFMQELATQADNDIKALDQ